MIISRVKGLLNHEQAAKIIGISTGTLRNWVFNKRKGMPVVKIEDRYYFDKDQIEAWLASGGGPRRPGRKPGWNKTEEQKIQEEVEAVWDDEYEEEEEV